MIKFYNSTKHKKIKYEYSVAHNDTNDSSNYDYDECLAFVQTENKVFSFDFVVCSYDERTEDNVGIWFIIVSDKRKEKIQKNSIIYIINFIIIYLNHQIIVPVFICFKKIWLVIFEKLYNYTFSVCSNTIYIRWLW